VNLEDEAERLNETLAVYIQRNSELRKELKEKLFETTISGEEVAKKGMKKRALQHSQDLDNHAYLITLLESQKLDNVQNIHTEEEKTSSLEAEPESLKMALQELENHKLSVEMRVKFKDVLTGA
jgi:hypothetical protein